VKSFASDRERPSFHSNSNEFTRIAQDKQIIIAGISKLHYPNCGQPHLEGWNYVYTHRRTRREVGRPRGLEKISGQLCFFRASASCSKIV